ncbi:MAG: hypothetical protein ACM3YM_07900 [Sphingomonadales bacterium]
MPAYDPARSGDIKFARSLEALCGENAAGAFEKAKGALTLKLKTLSSARLDNETLWCLLNSAEVSGLPLGFAGNGSNESDKHAGFRQSQTR